MVCLNWTLNLGLPFRKGMEASPSRVPTIISLCIWFKVIVCLYSRSAFLFSVFVLSSTFFFFRSPFGLFNLLYSESFNFILFICKNFIHFLFPIGLQSPERLDHLMVHGITYSAKTRYGVAPELNIPSGGRRPTSDRIRAASRCVGCVRRTFGVWSLRQHHLEEHTMVSKLVIFICVRYHRKL